MCTCTDLAPLLLMRMNIFWILYQNHLITNRRWDGPEWNSGSLQSVKYQTLTWKWLLNRPRMVEFYVKILCTTIDWSLSQWSNMIFFFPFPRSLRLKIECYSGVVLKSSPEISNQPAHNPAPTHSFRRFINVSTRACSKTWIYCKFHEGFDHINSIRICLGELREGQERLPCSSSVSWTWRWIVRVNLLFPNRLITHCNLERRHQFIILLSVLFALWFHRLWH